MLEPNPITWRMLQEEAASVGLTVPFFDMNDPDKPVTCTCQFKDLGHEPECAIVYAHDLRDRRR